MFRNTACSATLLTLLFSFPLSTALPQERATITGTVKDVRTGEPLPGATVLVQNSGLGVSTDMDGRFVIRNVLPGPSTLRAVYVGYLEKELKVEIKEGETQKQNIWLTAVGIESEEVVVTVQAGGQNAAINQQLAALPITNVVSRDRMQELPDANAAESVSRLPGVSLIRTGGEGAQVVIRGLSPQYNQITINGVEMPSNVASTNNIIGTSDAGGGLDASGAALGDRGADLSMISSNMLGGIKVTKAITPDMDAAVIGGVVDFALRKAVRSESNADGQGRWLPFLEFKAQGGYTNLKNSYDNYRYAGSLEHRFFDQRFGIFVQGSAERRDLSSNVLQADYELIDMSHADMPLPQIDALNLSDVFRKRQRYGGTVVLDYQHGTGNIALMNFLSRSKTQEIIRGEFMDPNPAGTDVSLAYRANEQNNELNVLTNLLSVEQDLSIVQANLRLSHSYTESRNPEDLYNEFWQRGSSADFANRGDMSYVQPRVLATYARHDATNSWFHNLIITKSLLQERTITASMDLAADVTFASDLSSAFKVGGMFQHRTREYDFNHYEWPLDWEGSHNQTLLAEFPWLIMDSNGRIRMDSFTQDSYDYHQFLNGEYALAYPMNINRLWEIAPCVKSIHSPNPRKVENLINDYTGYEDKGAGYAMAQVNFGQDITFLPGVRYQNLAVNYTAMGGTAVPGGLQGDTATAEHSHGYWLPMVHARYRPFGWMQIHFAYTNTLNYPDYSVLTPRYLISMGYIDYNNHALKPATSENLDLVVSFHSNEIGLLALTGFKKRIKDLVFFSTTYISDLSKYPELPQGGTQLYTFNSYINNPMPVDLWGIETEWQTHFWYLPKPFDGLVLNINYTHIFSEAKYPRSERRVYYDEEGNSVSAVSDSFYTSRMLNQPNDIVNLAMGYDYRGFSLRLSMLYQDNIFKHPDFWMQQRINSARFTRWDLSVKQDFSWLGLQIFFNISDITGEDDVDVNQRNGYPASQQRYGMSADLGLQIRL
jgi:TonB-dependent receptor